MTLFGKFSAFTPFLSEIQAAWVLQSGFVAWNDDHPLTKTLVYHDQDRIEVIDRGEIGNEIH